MRTAAAACLFMITTGMWADPSIAQAPLSIIDWLETEDSGESTGDEPITDAADVPDIEVRPLDVQVKPIGLVPSSVTGLPEDLWQSSNPDTLVRLINAAPVVRHPALQSLLYSLLLTEALPPKGDEQDDKLLLARIDKLLELGATDPAMALMEHAGPAQTPQRFERWTDMAFLTGTEDEVCSVLARAPHLSPNRETLIFCAARRGDVNLASLLFDASQALGDLDPQIAPALDRFLHPELFEKAESLPVPRSPDPLLFRLYEAIGERLPTASLPRKFAAADLRDIAGWKAQIEATERLARTGAIPSNTLLGLYTDRLPAASGGVWDRVAAVQRFETALDTGSKEAVAKTLPDAWAQMDLAGLTVPFSDLFATKLVNTAPSQGDARLRALEMALLSPQYELLTRQIQPQSPEEAFWIGVAQGLPDPLATADPLSRAISDGFDAPPDLPRSLNADQLGETLLRAIALFDRGSAGNLDDLTAAIATFRALGLEDVARRASLNVLIQQTG